MVTGIVAGIAALVVVAIVVIAVLRRKMGARPLPPALKPGQPLPEFSAVDERGDILHSASLKGRAAVILFVRGNWCPFCSRQVADLTKQYRAINDLGARLILITPKPLETTRRVAQFFEFDFEFWLDQSLSIGRQLGLLLSGGVPSDYRKEYGEDTLWPASLVVDREGIIRYAAISRFIADRPNPRHFVRVLNSI